MPYRADQQCDNMGTLSCRSDWLSCQLAQGTNILILDCRTPTSYNTSHVDGAMHVAIPSLMLRRLRKGNLPVSAVINCNEGKERFTERCKTDPVIIYDDDTKDINANPTSVVSLLVRRLQEEGCRVSLLEGGFTYFKQQYPQHCIGLRETGEESTILGLKNLKISDAGSCSPDSGSPIPSSLFTFPVKVLPYLFLGNAKNSADLDCLEKHGIKYILNVTPNVPNMFENEGDFKYLQIPISDHWSQNLAAFFPEAIAFIDEARKSKKGVLVHCLAGISRSVTVTVAYLMHHLSLSLNDAYDYVRKYKPNISPNFNFMGQLYDFERTLDQPAKCECGDKIVCKCKESRTFFTTPTTSNTDFNLEMTPVTS